MIINTEKVLQIIFCHMMVQRLRLEQLLKNKNNI